MQKLYDANGHIKIDAIERALHDAKRDGKLPNVSSNKLDDFMDGLREVMEEFHGRVGNQINKSEVEFLIKEMKRVKGDRITDSELATIAAVITNEDFEVR